LPTRSSPHKTDRAFQRKFPDASLPAFGHAGSAKGNFMRAPDKNPTNGMPYALAAYALWGLLPLYLHALDRVPPLEFVGWRTVCTLPVCLIIVLATRQGGALIAALTNPRQLAALGLSALLIGANWTIYVLAIEHGHVFAASLGYYINPLLNVLIGTLFLGERLGGRRKIAVALATAGVAVLAAGAWQTLGLSLTLAASFASYGLLRKKIPVGALPGLTIEAGLLTLPAMALIAYSHGPAGIAMRGDQALLLSASGVITAVPLLLFTYAAQRMDFSALGFAQFSTPTLGFLLALFYFHETLHPVQLASFVLIWAAIAVFCWDLWARGRRAKEGAA